MHTLVQLLWNPRMFCICESDVYKIMGSARKEEAGGAVESTRLNIELSGRAVI
jgi:hypothetical protein